MSNIEYIKLYNLANYDEVITQLYCRNPLDNTTQPQQNLNTVVGLDMKMTVQTTPPHPPHQPQKLNGGLQEP